MYMYLADSIHQHNLHHSATHTTGTRWHPRTQTQSSFRSSTLPNEIVTRILEEFVRQEHVRGSRHRYDGKGRIPLISEDSFWSDYTEHPHIFLKNSKMGHQARLAFLRVNAVPSIHCHGGVYDFREFPDSDDEFFPFELKQVIDSVPEYFQNIRGLKFDVFEPHWAQDPDPKSGCSCRRRRDTNLILSCPNLTFLGLHDVSVSFSHPLPPPPQSAIKGEDSFTVEPYQELLEPLFSHPNLKHIEIWVGRSYWTDETKRAAGVPEMRRALEEEERITQMHLSLQTGTNHGRYPLFELLYLNKSYRCDIKWAKDLAAYLIAGFAQSREVHVEVADHLGMAFLIEWARREFAT